MISAVTATFNETEKLEKCLNSLRPLADEIVIFNLSNNDPNLTKVARSLNARIVKHPKVLFVEKIRQEMLDCAKGDWVLIIDPDEEITSKLIQELKRIALQNKYDAVSIPRKNIILGQWMKNGMWWQDWQIRFVKKSHVKWSSVIHKSPLVKGAVYTLPTEENLALIHHTHASVAEIVDSHKRYTSAEAEILHTKGYLPTLNLLSKTVLKELLTRIWKHKGYKDGWKGLILVYLMVLYRVKVWKKLYEKYHK